MSSRDRERPVEPGEVDTVDQAELAAPRSPSPPPKRRRLAQLDTPMFPHVLDHILSVADYGALLALRGANRGLLARVDARLASTLVVRAPASKATPGVYIYTELGGPRAHPALSFYPFASDRPYSPAIGAAEDQWALSSAEEFGDTHWAWNYADGDWERAYSAWTATPAIPAFAESRPPLAYPPSPGPGGVPRPGFQRRMRASEVARAHAAAPRVLGAVRELVVSGPVGREGGPLFQLMRGVWRVRVERNARGEMVAKIPVPAPHVLASLSLASAARTARTESIAGTRLVEGAPRLVEGVRTLTVEVTVGGRCAVVPFARPHSLREVVYVLRPPNAEDGAQGDGAQNQQPLSRGELGFLHGVLDHGVVHAEHTGITIVGLDAATAPALSIEGVEGDEGVRDEFARRMGGMIRAKAEYAALLGSPWAPGRVDVLLTGVRLLSREEWAGRDQADHAM